MRSANDNTCSVVGFIARSPDRCWRAFTDAAAFTAWVPGLRRARVIASRPDGLPLEVLFELAGGNTYSLSYAYDLEQRLVSWEPRVGKRDGVRGFAQIEPWDGGCRLTYGLEVGEARTGGDATELRAVVGAFARWVEGGRPTMAALQA